MVYRLKSQECDCFIQIAADCGARAVLTSESQSSCSHFILLASLLTAVFTALLTLFIFLLILVAVRKCRPCHRPGGGERRASILTEEEEGPMYEQMMSAGEVGVAEGGMATVDYNYVGTEAARFELEQNRAYAMRKQSLQ